ncbi:MAG TPA: outer membrane protein assembly factor BamD [Gallionellaceae bacterium]
MRYSLALILLLTLTACGTPRSPSVSNIGEKSSSPDAMYAEAMNDMANRSYERSAKILESLLSKYPYGPYAQQAQMELAYAYYKHNEPDAALTAVDRFIKQYPTSPHLDYILYLKGVINFNYDLSMFSAWIPRDLANHDPQNVQDSFDAFKELVTRFPNSMYSPDARLRMQYLANTLARHEIVVSRYYMRRGAYIAALNRATAVLNDFPKTPQTMEALALMVQAYDALGLKKLRDDAQRVLDRNSKDRLPQTVKQ